MLELRGVSRRYPGVVACDGIDLALRAGEVHALLGENGAGKSTLIGMLAGTVRPDAGDILFDGGKLPALTPARSLAQGIGVAAQHDRLVPTLTVAENCLVGARGWRLRRADMAERLSGLGFEPDAPAGSLSPAGQLGVCIEQAIWRGHRVLALDEPTSPLGPAASASLLHRLRALAREGRAVLLVTHRLEEALRVADRVTVLRRGRVTGRLGPADLAAAPAPLIARIREMMFGPASPEPIARPLRPQGAPALVARGVGIAGELHDVSFTLTAGEILGVAGIEGNGQHALAEALAGLRRHAGALSLDGAALDHLDTAERFRRGVRLVSDDRMAEGTVGRFPIALNLVLKRIGDAPFWQRGIQRDRPLAARAEAAIAGFAIRAPGPWTPAAALSGGNRQKLMLARELDGAPRLIVWHKPTVGLDAQAAAAVRARIRLAAANGVAGIVISADLDELFALSDRIAVLEHGRFAALLDNAAAARARVPELLSR